MSGVEKETTLGYVIEREWKLKRAIDDALRVLDRVSGVDFDEALNAIVIAHKILSKAKQ